MWSTVRWRCSGGIRLICRRRLSSLCCVSGGSRLKPGSLCRALSCCSGDRFSMPLQPRAQMRLLVVFKPGMRTLLLRRASEAGGSRQRQYQQQRRKDTTSELPAVGCRLELVVPCHGGALRSGYVDRRIRAPRFPVFVST